MASAKKIRSPRTRAGGEMTESIYAIVLPIELTNGNDGRGSKWFSSAKRRKEYEAILLPIVTVMFQSPVVVHVTRLLGHGQRLWDSSSIGRGNWKEIEDSLVALGVFKDDSPQYIVETRFFQRKRLAIPKTNAKPATLLEVFEVW